MKIKTNNDMILYSQQFENSNKLIGQEIKEIVFYLEPTDKNFTEQPNDYGKSLLNGIDLKTKKETYSIGNRYTNLGYGLSIDIGHTDKLEYFDELKEPNNYKAKIIGEIIKNINIYWMNIPFEGEVGLYPQEIEILTESGYLFLSSIEVNNGEINTEFTNELLVIDNIKIVERLKLGKFGMPDNKRMLFNNLKELKEK
jgi:hypothetical protein